jgi:hypothetical protein
MFCRIDEEIFADLYGEGPSRPNVPADVLVGLEILKSGFGWSDRELYEQLCFNLRVRHAVGMEDLGEEVFELRTLRVFGGGCGSTWKRRERTCLRRYSSR